MGEYNDLVPAAQQKVDGWLEGIGADGGGNMYVMTREGVAAMHPGFLPDLQTIMGKAAEAVLRKPEEAPAEEAPTTTEADEEGSKSLPEEFTHEYVKGLLAQMETMDDVAEFDTYCQENDIPPFRKGLKAENYKKMTVFLLGHLGQEPW